MSSGDFKLQPREPTTPRLINVLHSPKRVRVTFGAETLADSRDALILRSNHFLPTYFFPKSSVRNDLLREDADRTRHELGGELVHWSIEADGKRSENAAWSFATTDDPILEPLKGYVAFRWKAVDRWFEEDEEIFVHPRDPYARIDTINSSSRVEVVLDGETIADTSHAVFVFETHLPTRYYIPKADVRLDRLVTSDSASRCPYKGIASYWSATSRGGAEHPDVAWSYEEPLPEIPRIKGLIAFYPQAVDEIRVDGERVS